MLKPKVEYTVINIPSPSTVHKLLVMSWAYRDRTGVVSGRWSVSLMIYRTIAMRACFKQNLLPSSELQ